MKFRGEAATGKRFKPSSLYGSGLGCLDLIPVRVRIMSALDSLGLHATGAGVERCGAILGALNLNGPAGLAWEALTGCLCPACRVGETLERNTNWESGQRSGYWYFYAQKQISI